jgi:CubicO group peptidase (beta-lactamase class C family)
MISQTDPSRLGLDPDRLRRINEMMERYVAEAKTAGMLTLVSRNGEIAHLASHGYMDLTAQTPMSTDTIFRIYSMTKPITSVALMTLLEAGKFQLDDAAHPSTRDTQGLPARWRTGTARERYHDTPIAYPYCWF